MNYFLSLCLVFCVGCAFFPAPGTAKRERESAELTARFANEKQVERDSFKVNIKNASDSEVLLHYGYYRVGSIGQDSEKAEAAEAEIRRRQLLTDEEWNLVNQLNFRPGSRIRVVMAAFGEPTEQRRSVSGAGEVLALGYVKLFGNPLRKYQFVVVCENGVITSYRE